MPPRIYLDLDGVIFDFDAHYVSLFGRRPRDVSDGELWKNIRTVPTFFRDLPLCPGALHFFEQIRHLDPIILTACPSHDYAGVARQKIDSVREHLGAGVSILPVRGGANKVLFRHSIQDILIDDHPRNIAVWCESGGRGILHTGFLATSLALSSLLPGYEAIPGRAQAPAGPVGETLPSAYEAGVAAGEIVGIARIAAALGVDLSPSDISPERVVARIQRDVAAEREAWSVVEDFSVRVFGRQAGDEPNVYDMDYDGLVDLSRKVRRALEVLRPEKISEE